MNDPASTLNHARAEHTHAFTLPLPAAEAFSFFEPVGEMRWAQGWHPVFATPDDAVLHEGSIFVVTTRDASGGEVVGIWTIVDYQPPHRIAYHNVLIGVRATRIAVTLRNTTEHSCEISVGYRYTGLSPAGDHAIRAITSASFSQMIEGWHEAIREHLKRAGPGSE